MRLIDISPPVHPGSPVWPGDSAFELDSKWSIAQGDSVTVGTVSTTTHIGAHIDAPAHIVQGAPSVSETPLDACLGPCLVLDACDLVDRTSSPHGQVSLSALTERIAGLAALGESPIERLLLKHYPTVQCEWDSELPGVAVAVMCWFAAQGGRLMGIDLASFDPAESEDLPCHHAAIDAGIVLLEGLDLSAALEGEAELIALPLPLVGADASPVRAVLRYEDGSQGE